MCKGDAHGDVDNTRGFQMFERKNLPWQFQIFAKIGGCPPVWMWFSTPWEGLGTTSPVRSIEENF
jgi:hypothetical protein